MNLNEVYSNFCVERVEAIKEIEGRAYFLTHQKSGARLLYLDVKDDNKVFSITFRTPPNDSTGVAHILEHSVLCGSRKFPLKEPFVELVKGSLNTFLNAMTYPDKTMYPVASKNDKDFANLMDVYLDAVFYPRVAHDPEIVMQEGWHYELEDENDELTYKGVVYNEMKGVFSSPDSILERHMMENLFPNTTYGVESGGDPDYITDLTYEQFVNFYHEYYHPSNSYLFLYGEMDILEKLEFLDKEYLSNFDTITPDSQIGLEKAFSQPVVKSYPYGVASDESVEQKTLHEMAFVMPELDSQTRLAFEVLAHALLSSPAAPLKYRLIEKGYGKDASGYFLDSLRQPLLNINISSSELEQQESIRAEIFEFFQEQVRDGLDKKMLEASLNIIEFALREADFGGRPKGLIYNIRLMDFWLYDHDPVEALRYEKTLESLRSSLNSNYFEELLNTHILKNQHYAFVSLYPQKDLLEAKERREKEKLQEVKQNMSADEISEIITQTKRLKERQGEADSPEALATIPLLELSDLSADVEHIQRHEKNIGKTKVHFVPTNANGINYVTYYFDLAVLNEEEFFYAELLSQMLSRVDTKEYNYKELAQEISMHLGGFSSAISVLPVQEGDVPHQTLLTIKSKALHSNIEKMLGILECIILESNYGDAQRNNEIIKEVRSNWDMGAFKRGHTLVSRRVLAQVSQTERLQDSLELGYYEFIASLSQNIDILDVVEKLKIVASKIFLADNLEVLFVGTEKEFSHFEKLFEDSLLKKWPHGVGPKRVLTSSRNFENEALVTSGKVQYVAKGGNFSQYGFSYTGALCVLETILRYEYLWLRIRVQGGAYGAFVNFYRNGNMVLCSYRDPNLEESLAIYDEIPEFLESFTVTEREMTKYIIGTMSQLDLPLTPALRGSRAMSLYFSGLTESDLRQQRQEALACTIDDIRSFAVLVQKTLADNHICVMGNEGKIKTVGQLFSTIRSLPN